ncbi:hypothetical protein D3C77_299450 [compost metagenome]
MFSADFVLFQHSEQHELLPFDRTRERLFVKVSFAVKSRIGGRELRQTCQISSLGNIEIVQVGNVKYALGRSLNPIHLVAI